MDFIDLDKAIVDHENKTISDIFEADGEEHFRTIESTLLKALAIKKDHFIMATGGGAPCFFDNMDFMNATGITLYIETGVEHLLARLSDKGITKRPLLKKIGQDNLEKGLTDKLKEREPFYLQATHILPYQPDLELDIIFLVKARK